MLKTWRNIFIVLSCCCFELYGFSVVFSQTKKPKKPDAPTGKAISQKTGCSSPIEKAGGKMTYLVGAGKLTAQEKERIENNYGKLIIPKGEVKRAKKIRSQALDKKAEQQQVIERGYQNWLKENPNALPEDSARMLEWIERAREKIANFEPEIVTKKKKFDWRENGLPIGAVLNQGEKCDTCWAFASASAFEASLKLIETRWSEPVMESAGDLVFLASPPPAPERYVASVQQLLSCMPNGENNICAKGWHGKAFEFMVKKKGAPLTLESWDTYNSDYQNGIRSLCDPESFSKAYSWDYVNSPPDILPTVEQLKTALIEHGPLVVPIVTDDCLINYKGGVFNEEDLGTVNHTMLLIGWDDEKGAWLVKNSWGEEWGEKGFAWIKYGSNNIGMFAAWIDADPTPIISGLRLNLTEQ